MLGAQQRTASRLAVLVSPDVSTVQPPCPPERSEESPIRSDEILRCPFTSLRTLAQNDGLSSGFTLSHFIMGILTPRSFATWMARSYPASTCRATPIPGSVVSTR